MCSGTHLYSLSCKVSRLLILKSSATDGWRPVPASRLPALNRTPDPASFVDSPAHPWPLAPPPSSGLSPQSSICLFPRVLGRHKVAAGSRSTRLCFTAYAVGPLGVSIRQSAQCIWDE